MATATIWHEPIQNRDGDGLPGATVTVYNADGVTPAVLYTDSAATLTMPNPLTIGVAVGAFGLDTIGNARFRAIPGEFVIVVEVDGDELYRSARTIPGFVTPIVVTSGAEYNVMDFMDHPNAGEGNPAVDDTQGFVDCFAAASASGSTGARVRVPGGVYYVDPEAIEFPSFLELDCELGCTWLVRRKGTAGQYGLHSVGIDVASPVVELHIRGLTFDGNYIKFFDGFNGSVNPDADAPGGPGGQGLSLYGEHITLEDVRVKNCKGIGMQLLGTHSFGAGWTNTGHQWDVRNIHVVNCYGLYGAQLAIVDSIIRGVQVINWDDDHLVTPGAPFSVSAVGQIGVVLASGGMKVSSGHIWGVGLWRALYAFANANVVSDLTLDTANDCGLWCYGDYNQFKNLDIYSLNPVLGATRKGIIMGSDSPTKDAWGNVIDAHIRNMGAGAIDWQQATRGNRVTATVVCEVGDPDILGDPEGGGDGGPLNVVDLIRLEN